tara:strand:- start:794 stop:1285 length:492 start_codon:yes stop_codon:yes gene_type:complete
MNDNTRDLLCQLSSTNWFENVVFNHNNKSENEINSWTDVFTHFTDPEFEKLLVAKYRPIATVANIQPREAPINSEWVQIVGICKTEMSKFVPKKIYNCQYIPEKFKKRTLDLVNWIIIYALRETEYADVIKTHFYRDWCDILLSGHFACYWDGDIEQGEFVVI